MHDQPTHINGGYSSPTTTPANGNPPQSASSTPTPPQPTAETLRSYAADLSAQIISHLGGTQ